MRYKLKFLPTALKEWKKLDNSIQAQFRKKLKERLDLISFRFISRSGSTPDWTASRTASTTYSKTGK